MKFRNPFIKLTASALMLILTAGAMQAIELPIKKINGKEYYYYQVKPKETIYSLCKQFGLTKAELIKYNPVVADGLRANQILYFPVDEMDQITAEKEAPQEKSKPKTIDVASVESTHFVEKGETIYGISKHYGITEEELIAANPSIAHGLKQGVVLNIPKSGNHVTSTSSEADVAEADNYIRDEEPATQPEQEPETETTVVAEETGTEQEAAPELKREPVVPAIPATTVNDYYNEEDTDAEELSGDEATEEQSEESDSTIVDNSVDIAVMLPFMLDQEKPDKQTQLYTEFYKGFLIAVDSLRNIGSKINIRAFDTAASIDTVRNLMTSPDFGVYDIIIAPDDEAQLNAISDFALQHDMNVMNIFAVKSELYKNNKAVMQANIPHSDMYDEAVTALLGSYMDYMPVLLIPNEGKTDKIEFVNKLRSELSSRNLPFTEIHYSGYLKESDLAQLEHDNRYIFVPASGTQTEFSHIIGALKTYRENLLNYNNVRLFGYPEWITFRSDMLENLHTMNSTIYSRFFNDDSSYRSRDFAELYKRWYGSPMMSAIPVQGILGFDTGFYIINAIHRDNNGLNNSHYSYDGIQSGYHFSKPAESEGVINDRLYFINFRPSGVIEKLPL